MSNENIQDMAELLRKGARMLSESCPICATPIFQLKTGDLFCSKCNKPVKILSKDEDIEQATTEASLESTLLKKLALMQVLLDVEENPVNVKELTETISVLFDMITKLKKKN